MPFYRFKDFHWKIAERMHRDAAGRLPRRNLILGFPGSAKSTVFTECRTAWLLLQNWYLIKLGYPIKPLTTLVGSQDLPKATERTRGIKLCLRAPNVRKLFGKVVSDRCSDEYFDLEGVQHTGRASDTILTADSPFERDFSVRAFGMESGSVTSYHADIVDIDDAVTFENSRTEHQRENLKKKMAFDVVRACNPGGQINWVGNHHHSADMYADLRNNKKYPQFAGQVFIIPALNKIEKSVWEERWATEELTLIRQTTPRLIWFPLYQQNIKPMEGGVINFAWFRWKLDEPPPPNLPVYIGVDPAIRQSEHADYFAVCVLAFDRKTRKRYEEEIFFGHLTWDERLNKLKKIIQYYQGLGRLAAVGVESQGGGIDLAEKLTKELEIKVRDIPSKIDIVSRLNLTSHIFQNGLVVLDGPERSDYMPDVGTFVEELLEVRPDLLPPPPRHDDRISAFLVANSMIPGRDTVMPIEAVGQRQMSTEIVERETAELFDKW